MRVNGSSDIPAPTSQRVEPAQSKAEKPVESANDSQVNLDRTRADAQLQRVSANQPQDTSSRASLNSALARELSARIASEQKPPRKEAEASAKEGAEASAEQSTPPKAEEPVTVSRDGVNSNQTKLPA